MSRKSLEKILSADSESNEAAGDRPVTAAKAEKLRKLKKKTYYKELKRLEIELVKLQEWVVHKGLKVVVIFEGRDAAGKGGAIKRITDCLNPRVCRIAALGKPTEKERTQVVLER